MSEGWKSCWRVLTSDSIGSKSTSWWQIQNAQNQLKESISHFVNSFLRTIRFIFFLVVFILMLSLVFCYLPLLTLCLMLVFRLFFNENEAKIIQVFVPFPFFPTLDISFASIRLFKIAHYTLCTRNKCACTSDEKRKRRRRRRDI